MKTVSRAAVSAAVIISLTLAGCGGSQSVGSTPAAFPTPSPTPGAASNAAARATMQSSLTTVEITSSTDSPLTLLTTRRAIKSLHARHPKDTTGCEDGTESTYTTDPVTGFTDSVNTVFYDQACTEPEFSEALNVTSDVVTDTSEALAATGSATYYNTAGTVTQYDPLTLSATTNNTTENDTFTITESQEAAINGTPYGTLGTTCNIVQSTTTLTCGAAAVFTSNGSQSGLSVLESYTVNGSSTPSSTVSAAAYTAAGGLAIAPGTAPAWTVTGASPVDTITGTLSVGALQSGDNSGTISLNDPATGVAVTGTITYATGVTLTETLAGKQLAAATVNPAGNGTISYADGTTATIVNWTVEG